MFNPIETEASDIALAIVTNATEPALMKAECVVAKEVLHFWWRDEVRFRLVIFVCCINQHINWIDDGLNQEADVWDEVFHFNFSEFLDDFFGFLSNWLISVP